MNKGYVLSLSSIVVLLLMLTACGSKEREYKCDWGQITKNDTLRILTLYSSTSYFIYKGEEMGYEVELAKAFAKAHDLVPQVVVARNIHDLSRKLVDGEGDMIAYPIPVTISLKDSIIFCGRKDERYQVLIRNKAVGKPLKDVTELIGKSIRVLKGSRYDERLQNLNKELGGGIEIEESSEDSITTEELIRKVALGEIEFTISDDATAQLNKTYFNNIDISLAVSFPQKVSWAVRKTSPKLAKKLDEWDARTNTSEEYKSIYKKYFEWSKLVRHKEILDRKKGIISVHDEYFKRFGKEYKVDWRLLAAIAFEESNFETDLVGWAGSKGIMQIMPESARRMGVPIKEMAKTETNIKLGAMIVRKLLNLYKDSKGEVDQIKIMLAAYNIGSGHISDAKALAAKYGKSKYIWTGNVEYGLKLKSNEEYFNDPVCRLGYVRGDATLSYVRSVYDRYLYYKKEIPQ